MNDQSPSAWRVMQIVSLAQKTLDSLREDHGQIIETEDELYAALADEGASVDGLLSAIGRGILDARADVDAANARIDALCARRDRHAKREERLRDTLLQAMQAIGLKSFRGVEFAASISDGRPKVVVTDETLLPPELIRTTTTSAPDRLAIAAALKLGSVDGAVLSNGSASITIRSKQ